MKKILIILTGGTLAMVEDAGRLRPAANADIIGRLPQIREVADFEVIELFNIDSSDMQIHHWQKLAATIAENMAEYDGFVVIHGTDTMVYTASALSYMLVKLPKPVILTGSQKPISSLLSDAPNNVLYAAHMATLPIPEVCIYFDYMLFRGNRTIKASSINFSAFQSPNYPALASAGVDVDIHEENILERHGNFQVQPQFSNKIFHLRLYPGIDVRLLEELLDAEIKAFMIQAFGMGNVPAGENNLLNFIRRATSYGKVVVIASQSHQGTVDLSRYEAANHALEAGALSSRDMTLDAAITKLMHLVGRNLSAEAIAGYYGRSLAGELTD
jgi:L-asparaginase